MNHKNFAVCLAAVCAAVSFTACGAGTAVPQSISSTPSAASQVWTAEPASSASVPVTPDTENSPAFSQDGYIGTDAAEKAAVDHVKAGGSGEARILLTDLDREDGRAVYEVLFLLDNQAYEVEVDALTGQVLKAEQEDQDLIRVPDDPDAEAKARKAAFERAGIRPEEAENFQVGQDWENHRTVYEYEFTAGGYDYEIEVDKDGTVLKFGKEAAEVLNAGPTIGKKKALAIALDHAGVTDAANVKSELDEENGTLVYEVEFKAGGMEYEYEIDAATGAILKAEKEIDD